MIKILLPLTLLSLNCFAYDKVPYNRAVHYGEWIDIDGDCQDVRAELLIKESENNGVGPTFVKSKDGKNCTVATGKWIDYYTDIIYTNAKDIQIDHIISLKQHYEAIGSTLTQKQRVEYANEPTHLVITKSSLNMSKGAKDLSEFIQRVPQQNKCKYIRDVKRISDANNIPLDNSDNEIINQNPACFKANNQ
jgi:hypothetical protein